MIDTKNCPCCNGAGVHRKQHSVDDFVEVGCGACVEGQVPACENCDGEGSVVGSSSHNRWLDVTKDCPECQGTGLEDYVACDLAKTLQRKRVRPASEDFK